MKRFTGIITAVLSIAIVATVGIVFGPVAMSNAEATVSFENDVQPLFNNNCVFCHMTGAASGDLVLEPGNSYENLVNVKSGQADMMRVTPEDAEKSYLYHKLAGTHLTVGGTGSQMPLAGTPFSEEQLQIVQQWILEGAQNN